MTWKEHIAYIASKIAKNIGVIARTKYILPSNIRIKLYYSLVQPYLSYCNIVWGSTYATRLHRLNVLQKRAVRLVVGAPYGSHTAHIFTTLKILKVDQIGILQIGEFMYRYDRNLLPSSYKHFFQLSSQVHSYFTRNSSAYRRTYARTNTRLFSIKSIGVAIWEKIPKEIRLSPSIWLFKNKLSTYLIECTILTTLSVISTVCAW